MAGLVREAADRAMADADLDWADVDAVVLGKAPDVLEGVMSPELFLADALAAVGKPVIRAYTSGNAGGVAASTGVAMIGSGAFARVLVVSFEKQSEGKAAGATLQHVPFEARWQGGTGSLFAAICSEYIDRSGAPAHIGDVAALKDRQNAVRNPYAQVRRADITLEAIADVEDAVGADPVPPLVAVVGRRVRGRPRRRGRGGAVPGPGVGARLRGAHGAAGVAVARQRRPACRS